MKVLQFLGTEYDANRGSTRVAIYSLLFPMVILFSAYSAEMTSILSVFRLTMPFQDLVGMYRDTDYKIGSVENTAWDNFFNVRIYN